MVDNDIEFILVGIVLILGVSLIIFASRVGKWIFNISLGTRRGLSEMGVGKCLYNRWMFSWATLELRFGRSFDIWLIRIIGIGFVAGAILLLFTVVFFPLK